MGPPGRKMNALRISAVIVTFLLLTILTQIGGLVLILSLLTHQFIKQRVNNLWGRRCSRLLAFIVLYLFCVFVIVPLIAKPFGRVPLPLFRTNQVQPGIIWTCLLNRNYVTPVLKATLFSVADKLNKKYPGTVVNYLEANFPFINGFPLPPHLSHNDGKKLDLSFQYNDRKSGLSTTNLPSFFGYGVCEAPKGSEQNMPDVCARKGYWQYNFISQIISQDKNEFVFDDVRTKRLVNLFAEQATIGKIFIEPHLKTRLGLVSTKIRFHGCQAVRHDDHIHVQLK
jgi:hypothetical protein